MLREVLGRCRLGFIKVRRKEFQITRGVLQAAGGEL